MARESDAPMRMPSMEQAFALAKRAFAARNKANDMYQPVKDQEAAFYENGNGNPKQQALIKRLVKARDKNEIAALQEAALYEQAIEYFIRDTRSRGHAGDLVEMANGEDEECDDAAPAEPQSAAAAAEAIFKKQDAETEANQAAFREKFDIPAEGVEAPAEAVEDKPKRGRKAKTPEAITEAAPPPPPPALKDDDEEEPSPTPRRQRGTGTFAVVH